MNDWLALDAEVRLAICAVVGLLLGGIVNWAVSSFAYDAAHFSPWSRHHPRDARSPWFDRAPLIGWLRLRRKTATLGRGFWIRPLVVEVGMSAACAGLYWWEVLRGGLLPDGLPLAAIANPAITFPLHFAYAAHVLLLTFMLAASLVDVDEMTIPDAITVPGTLVGIVLITAFPWALLPAGFTPQGNIVYLFSTFPNFRPVAPLQAFPNLASLAIACGCYLLWCIGLLPRPWRTRHGYGRAIQILTARIARDRSTPWIGLLALAGLALITIVWLYEPARWIGLGTSLIGVAVGGAIVWIVRTIGTWALGREAMGFGDVTLLAMIGSYVGWQAVVLIFFAAPVAALLLGVVQWLIVRTNVLPYGPFLCVATIGIVCGWSAVWNRVGDHFTIGWLIPGVLVVGFALLGLILALLRLIRGGAPREP